MLLPGVGSALNAMQRLNGSGVAALLPKLVQPVLGICLGMQLLFQTSEEGPAQCLGVLPQTVRKLASAPGRPIPHMGWNQLHIVREDPLLAGVADGEYVYFVHSYAAPVSQSTLATCRVRGARCRRGSQEQLLGHAVSSRALHQGRRSHTGQLPGAHLKCC